MKSIITKIRQCFCDHDWRPSRFQALVPGMDYDCVKCGKFEHFYSRPPQSGSGPHTTGSGDKPPPPRR